MATLYEIYNASGLTPTITCASLASSAARQSTSVDFGVSRFPNYNASLGCSFAVGAAPVAGTTLDVYVGWSSGNFAGVWPGNLGVSDAAYTGYGLASNSLAQLDFVGSLVLSNTAATGQMANIGSFTPKLQYGVFVVYNNTAQSLSSVAADNNNSLKLIPIIDVGL